MIPFTEPVKSIVMLLPPPAKEATGKKMPNKKNTSNGRINRFIKNSLQEVSCETFA